MPPTRRPHSSKPATRSKIGTGAARPPRGRRNRPAEERTRELLDAALELFSSRGMSITIQSLADRVNVTQPLVHRYFPTKADLIAAICSQISEAHWDPLWHAVLTDRTRPLEERIPDFYESYLPHIYHSAWYRGFLYAALHDPRFAQIYLDKVERHLLFAIIDEVRGSFGFPAVDCIEPHEREVELVWGMHSTLIFHGIRRYVYETRASHDVPTILRDQLQAFLHMAPIVMAELMPGQDGAAKTPRLKKAAAY
jgi:AcrR family transcriptional regulator